MLHAPNALVEDPLPSVHRAASMPTTPSRSRDSFGDRFLPSRTPSARLSFSLLDRELAAASPPSRARGSERDEGGGAYTALLRSELLGCPPSTSSAAVSPERTPARPPRAIEGSPLRRPNSAGGAGLFQAPAQSYLPSPAPFAGSTSAAFPPSPQRRHAPAAHAARRMLRFAAADAGDPPPPVSPYAPVPIATDARRLSPTATARRIARAPFKVLDAPGLVDDFYLNLVDWSAGNVLAVGLGSSVYLWSAASSKVTRLVTLEGNQGVCSVGWSRRGSHLAVGADSGEVQIWDAAKGCLLRTLPGHRGRVGCLAWGGVALATGGRDRAVLSRDLRLPDEAVAARLAAHRSEVCGLRWSPDDCALASGGNDNQLLVWDVAASASPMLRFVDHTAAVKAVAWSPHQHGLLASGGGTADRCIRFWNTASGSALHAVDTGSQVCNLSWSKNVNELVSTHGYSQNQIVVWRYPTMQKLATLTGHSYRVLYLAASPDGETIVTGAGDETLRFWNVFPGSKSSGGGAARGMSSLLRTTIR